MAAIFQLRRGETNISIADGELYLHKGSGSIQFGSGSNNPITLLPLNAPAYGDIDLSGSISASGDVRIGGNIYLGNASVDTIQTLGQFTTNLVPSPHNSIDVGTTSAYWRNIYATNISGALAATNGVVSGSSQITLESVSGFSTFNTALSIVTGSLISTASANTISIANLNTFSGSQLTQNEALAIITGSLILTASANTISISNLNSFSSSQLTQNVNLATITGSLISTASANTISITELNSYSASLKNAITVSGIDSVSTTTIKGDLIVQGTTTQINSTQVNIGENILELNFGGSSTEAGIYTKDATGLSTTSGSLLWDSVTDYWKAGKRGLESKILLADGDSVISSSAQLTELNSFTSSANIRLNNLESTSASVNTSIVNLNSTTESLNTSVSNINASTSSLNSFSASVLSSLVSIYQTTASLNDWSASAKIELSNLELKSASVDTSILNINTHTASVNVSITNLNSETASMESRFTTLSQVTASLITATSSLFWTGSNHEARLDELEYTTSINLGSGAQVSFSEINKATASLNSFTASIGGTNIWTASTDSRLNNLELTSASINAWSSSLTTTFATDAEVAAGYEAKGRGIFSGSSQVDGTQITNNSITIAGTSVSLGGSITAAKILEGTNVISSSTQITSLLPAGVVSGSSQIDLTATTNYGSGILTRLNVVGVISGSSQISLGSATGNITLATQTTGDYVASLVQGTGVTITNNSGENSTPTIAIGQAVGTSANVEFSSIGVGTTASGTAGEIRATGDITAYYSSDIRLKENIVPIPNALEKIKQISGNTYDWKEGYDEVHSHKGNDVGVIAQEIETILPQIVTNRDTGFKAVQYEKIIPLLIEAIKELSDKIDRLENK